jgi:biotin synthase
MINKIKEKVLSGYEVSYGEAVMLSQVANKEELYKAADEIREHFCGKRMDLCSITNAKSGKCSQNCKWCSQSASHKTNVEEYDLVDRKEAVRQAVENAAMGVNKHSLVTSGKRVTNATLNNIIGIYSEIKSKCDIKLCASMGLIEKEQLTKLKDVGVEHYHCNLETAPSFFPELCTSHTIEDKIETIKAAQEVGLGVCSGGIIGMGETMEQRIELAVALKELNILSIPINILTPVEGTPLEGQEDLSEEEVLTTIALFRFINPKANLRFAGGRMKIKHFQHKALRSGINAALTGNYLTTIGSDIKEDLKDFKASGFEIENT